MSEFRDHVEPHFGDDHYHDLRMVVTVARMVVVVVMVTMILVGGGEG